MTYIQWKVCCDGSFSDCAVSKLCIGSTPVQAYGSTTYDDAMRYLRSGGGPGSSLYDWKAYCADPGTYLYCGVGKQPTLAYLIKHMVRQHGMTLGDG